MPAATYSRKVAVSNLTIFSPFITVCRLTAIAEWLYCSPLGGAITVLMPSAVFPMITVLPATDLKSSVMLIVSNSLFHLSHILAYWSVFIVLNFGTLNAITPPAPALT